MISSATYTLPNSSIKLEVRVENHTVWLTQKEIGEVFGVSVKTVSEHLQNAFKGGEVSQNTVVRKCRITARDGKKYETKCYSLEAVLCVGYRVNPGLATKFRLWVDRMLKEQTFNGMMGTAGKSGMTGVTDEAQEDEMAYSQEDTAVEEYVEFAE